MNVERHGDHFGSTRLHLCQLSHFLSQQGDLDHAGDGDHGILSYKISRIRTTKIVNICQKIWFNQHRKRGDFMGQKWGLHQQELGFNGFNQQALGLNKQVRYLTNTNGDTTRRCWNLIPDQHGHLINYKQGFRQHQCTKIRWF